MSSLRHRNTPDIKGPRVEELPDSEGEEHVTTQQGGPRNADDDEDDAPGISLLDILRLIAVAFFTSCALSYMVTHNSFIWGYKAPWWTRPSVVARYFKGPIELTPSQLARYDGSDPSLPIYLAINGTIFDVSANPRIYGDGGSYNVFAGVDATRGYVTGCFSEDRTPDLRGVEVMFLPIEDCRDTLENLKEGCEGEVTISRAQLKIRREQEMRNARKAVRDTVDGWVKFYKKSDKYFEVGRVIPEPGSEGQEEPIRKLCPAAESQRPKRSEMSKLDQERKESALGVGKGRKGGKGHHQGAPYPRGRPTVRNT